MELAWLEDFIVLARTKHFSRAAEERNVSQPAFSRRIQALESWLGTRLIDRRTTPINLTPEGERFRETAIGVLRDIYRDRDAFRRDFSKMHSDVRISGSTSVLVHFVPDWLTEMMARVGPFKTNVGTYGSHNTGTPSDMVQRLRQGEVDFTFTYAHPSMPWILDTANFDWKVVATTPFRPYSPRDGNGGARFELPGAPDSPLPWLAYATDSVLARAEGLAVQSSPHELHLQIVHQSMGVDMLKRLALHGEGFGWFPAMSVAPEVADGRLVPVGSTAETVNLEIRLYRSKSRPRPLIDKIWSAVEEVAPA